MAAAFAACLAIAGTSFVPGTARGSGGYEGFGARTPGGDGGSVYHVTRLDDPAQSTPGTLRHALAAGGRTVVFDVGGTIPLGPAMVLQGAYVTIDATTAPAPGITLAGAGLVLRGDRGAHDVVVRGLRVRDAADDGIQVGAGAHDIVLDHVSVTGSADGNVDITQQGTRNVTLSWSIVGANAKNMLLEYGAERVSMHHNVFVGSPTRSPQTGSPRRPATGRSASPTLDFRRNVVTGWGSGRGSVLRSASMVNIVGNYYGEGDPSDVLVVCSTRSREPECGDGQSRQARAFVAANTSRSGFDFASRNTEAGAFAAPPVSPASPCEALARAGARPLDAVDSRLLAGLRCP